MVLVAVPTGNGPVRFGDCGDLQILKQLEDQLIDTTVALFSTRSAVGRLLKDCRRCVVKTEWKDQSGSEESEGDVCYQLMDYLRELEWLLQQTKGLQQKLSGTSQLVPIETSCSCRTILMSPNRSRPLLLGVVHVVWKILAWKQEKRILRYTFLPREAPKTLLRSKSFLS
jgi:hypothetical protein